MAKLSIVIIAICLFAILFTDVKGGELSGVLRDFVEQDIVKLNINATCETQLLAIRSGIREQRLWALKLFDASGSIPSDFIYGNNFLTGSPMSCLYANTPFYRNAVGRYEPQSYWNLTLVTPPFPVVYRVAHAQHFSKLQLDTQTFEKHVLDFGFCLPTVCSDLDAEKIFKQLIKNDTFTNTTIFGPNLKFLKTKTLGVKDNFFDSPVVKAFSIIVLIIVTLICLELLHRSCKKHLLGEINEKSESAHWEKFLQCFSVAENYKIIAQRDVGVNGIKVLHGLKLHAITIIISSHLGIFGAVALSNYSHLFFFMEEEWLQTFHTMHFSVETFFVISATLFSHVFFKLSQNGSINNSFVFGIKAILARYFRLTPAYMMQILTVITVDRLFKQVSPYYLVEDNEERCTEQWLYNVLYINNFTPIAKNCIISSYFLATDFQLFLIALFLLLIIRKSKFFGLFLSGCVIVWSVIGSGYLGFTQLGSFTFTELLNTAEWLYSPFWIHVLSYFPGIFTGWFLCYKDKKLQLSKIWICILWIIASCVIVFLPFIHQLKNVTPLMGMAYAAFIRFIWSCTISWIIIACETGHGGFFGRALSCKHFRFYSRISYSAYLFHPAIIHLIFMKMNFPHNFEFPLIPIYFFGVFYTINWMSLVYLLMFEAPFVRLFKLLIN